MLAAIDHARTIRERLRNPPNAIPDRGIDLKRKVIPIAAIVDAQPVNVIRFTSIEEQAFGPTVCKPSGNLKVEEIIRAVAQFYDVSMIDIKSGRRSNYIVRPRQVAAYLAKTLTLWSLPFIGRRMGGRDHTTILHSVRKIERLRSMDPYLESDLVELARRISDVPLRPAFNPNEAHHASAYRAEQSKV